MQLSYERIVTKDISETTMQECAKLFNANYGVWGPDGPKPGASIKMSAKRIVLNCLPHPINSGIAIAIDANTRKIVAYAAFSNSEYREDQMISWITQLVVSTTHRGLRLSENLIKIACQFDVARKYAYGLVSYHPFAIKAFESAIGQKCDIAWIKTVADEIMDNVQIPYLKGKYHEINVEVVRCVMKTEFPADHSEADDQRYLLGSRWSLGDVEAGEEFLAILPSADLE